MKGKHVKIVCVGWRSCFIERDPGDAATPFGRAALPCMLDQNASHQLCCDREEMRPVLPVNLACAEKTEESLVGKGGGLERMSRSLAAKLIASQATKLRINDGNQLVERLVVAFLPSYE